MPAPHHRVIGMTRRELKSASPQIHRADRFEDEGMHDNFWNSFNTRAGALDALARVDLLAGDPVLDRRLAALADADPLGLHVPRRQPPRCGLPAARDCVSPEHYAYRLPTQASMAPSWRVDGDA
ncbi:MAG TPA: hypothetical protein VL522_11800 [Bordetella sp.]|nr:hypothetical protein [Bordetella sp.]